MANIKLIAGLGNPGKKYSKTRHNLGFNVLGLLAEMYDTGWKNWKNQAEIFIKSAGEKIIFAKPSLFMNNSGISVREILNYYGIAPDEMLVVCDDFSLELGVLRLRLKGSSGGHNGLESIITETGTGSFPRLRLGIGPVPRGVDPADFVLSEFAGAQKDAVNEMQQKAAGMIELAIEQGIEKAVSMAPSTRK